MQLKKTFDTDKSSEENGKWYDIGDNARIKVARFGNSKHRKALTKLRSPYKPLLLRGGQIPEEANDTLITESIAQTILLDWEGIQDEKGHPIPFSLDNCREALNNYKDFLDLVSQLSLDAANYRAVQQEEIVKK